MSGGVRTAVALWRQRGARSGELAFTVYLLAMVALVAVAPVVRAVWLGAAGPGGLALFADPRAPRVIALVAAVIWAAALAAGPSRGPALRPPALSYALGASAIPRSRAFLGPVLTAGILSIGLWTAAAVLAGGSLAANGMASATAVAGFVAAGALGGAVTVCAWLLGQALPRLALPAAAFVLCLGALAVAVPAAGVATPMGWVAAVYPLGGATGGLIPLTVLALALAASVPWLLDRLRTDDLLAQASRADAAQTSIAGLDLGQASELYRARPAHGRRLRALASRGPLWSVVLRRDAVGSLRTPLRLALGATALALAGVLAVLALVPGTPTLLLGAVAGLLSFAGLGPVTDGIRHAASAAADVPLYGVADATLVAWHALFPLVVAVALATLAAGLAVTVVPVANGASAVLVAVLGALMALALRLASALKGPMPPALLAPVPTPMGDPMAGVRLVWALDAVVLAAASGAAIVLLPAVPLATCAVAGVVTATIAARWRGRR
ncbi:hypothetical protein QE374_001302 [Microbacterium sp. SORGH_AS428]|uniref:hypothetical protein n=1 Tax=Microbacterium sp. SORGH_AS_0428 TaxID=3041788 RepID=UPI002863BE03|nr:hypothetical protein [Microbacterium sp. SORGH_AS_0428]MDR6199393.1 hypothetical protein [Microbacterium sp. SORGH_AS_0428]